jgi:uncharacterized membrane protein
VLVVAFGAVQALIGVVGAILRKSADKMEGRQIWIRFATWILLALEFALAADLVRTAVAPTWDDIAKLAVIATIRTMLNYFLAKDIAEFEPQKSALSLRAGAPSRDFFPPYSLDPCPVMCLSGQAVVCIGSARGKTRFTHPAYWLGGRRTPVGVLV